MHGLTISTAVTPLQGGRYMAGTGRGVTLTTRVEPRSPVTVTVGAGVTCHWQRFSAVEANSDPSHHLEYALRAVKRQRTRYYKICFVVLATLYNTPYDCTLACCAAA